MYCNMCQYIRANIYQHVLACIMLVFGMYDIMIHTKTDQIHAFVLEVSELSKQYTAACLLVVSIQFLVL